MEENKQVVAEWKALNQPRLQEIKSANPDLYSAVNLALQYLNQKLGGDELPEEVEQEVEEEVVVETTPVETKQWTLRDFQNIKIVVDTPEKSKKFQELFFSLGGEWSQLDSKVPNSVSNLDKIYLVTTGSRLLYLDTYKTFEEQNVKQIFYEDIFPEETTANPLTLEELKGTYVYLDTEDLREEYQKILFDLGGEWILTTKKVVDPSFGPYFVVNKFGQMRYFKDSADMPSYQLKNITKEWPEMRKRYVPTTSTQTQTATSTPQNGYTLPIETYPSKLNNKYSFFEANDGSRKSPTQSAGDLKRAVMNMPGNELTEILSTKFRGNDKNWYEINVGKGGTWTWKKLNPIDNYATQNKFIQGTQPTNASTSFTSTATSQTQLPGSTKTWRPEDLVGKKLLWSGREYDVIKFRRNNPKYKSYTLRTSSGTELEGKLTMRAIENLLNDIPVKGISIIKPQGQPTSSNSFEDSIRFLSDVELKQLYDETEEARKEFSSQEPEYLELTSQIVAIGNEMDNRNI
jgi:hypothetical protein